MSEEKVLRSKTPNTEIPEISVGEYLLKKLVNIENKTCLVSEYKLFMQ